VAFSIENKAIMNIKQKRLEKSKAKNPLYTGEHTGKCGSKRAKSVRNNEDSATTRTQNGSVITEETEEFVGMTAKPGNKKLHTRFGLKTQAEIHKQSVRKDKRRQKIKHKSQQQRRRMEEKRKDPQVSVKMQSLRVSEMLWSQNLLHLLL
jgi:nucleolar protein 4